MCRGRQFLIRIYPTTRNFKVRIEISVIRRLPNGAGQPGKITRAFERKDFQKAKEDAVSSVKDISSKLAESSKTGHV